MTTVIIQQDVLAVVMAPPDAPQVRLNVPSPPQVVIVPVGAQGPAGPAGDGVQSDPGDFTLIFENQLI